MPEYLDKFHLFITVLPKLLHQLLPSGSLLVWFSIFTSLMNCDSGYRRQINSFHSRLLLAMMFHHSTCNPDWQKLLSGFGYYYDKPDHIFFWEVCGGSSDLSYKSHWILVYQGIILVADLKMRIFKAVQIMEDWLMKFQREIWESIKTDGSGKNA